MHEHKKCEHNCKYCEECDVVYCEKCGTEWGKGEARYVEWHYTSDLEYLEI